VNEPDCDWRDDLREASTAYCDGHDIDAVKCGEMRRFRQEISPREREHLLLNV
jgi:hypothetical protein